MSVIQGTVETGYEAVRDLLEQQFANGEHIGAGVSVYHHGRKVVDIWGGLANEDTKAPWLTDTMPICYSTTKGLTATCLHVLADRGLVDYQAPVAEYWPEFAQNGKADITVYQILTHQSGMSQIPEGISGPGLLDWERVIHGLEKEAPAWEPGTASGYHAMTFGFLVGEIVRRVSGKSVGTFLRDELAMPLGISDEMFIGAPESVEPRIAKLKAGAGPTEEGRQMMLAMAATPDGKVWMRTMGIDLDAPPENADWLDTPAGHRSEVPAVSGIMTARALARFYAALANFGELDGVRVLSEATVRAMSKVQTLRPDKIIIVPVAWSLGYMNGGQAGWPQGPRDTAFGHIGLGGSVGYADPEIGMSFGFVVNKMTMDLVGAGRTAGLAAAARASCEAMG